MDEILKSENMQKRSVFYVYVISWEQSGQAGVENGAMLTTYLFTRTSECTISYSQIFKIFFASCRRQGGIDPPNQKILRTFLARFYVPLNKNSHFGASLLANWYRGEGGRIWVWYSETALCEFPIAARLVANRYTFVTPLTYVHKYDT